MKKLLSLATAALVLAGASSASALVVPVENLLLGTGGPGTFIPGAPPTASVFFDDVSVTLGPDTFVFDITVEASSFDPGGPSSVAQTAAGLGVSPGGGGLLDPSQVLFFSASFSVESAPAWATSITFDGYTDIEPNNPALVGIVPPLTTPQPIVAAGNVSPISFGIALASLQFTAVPEPSAFLYGGVVAAIAGIGYRGRRWMAGPVAEEA